MTHLQTREREMEAVGTKLHVRLACFLIEQLLRFVIACYEHGLFRALLREDYDKAREYQAAKDKLYSMKLNVHWWTLEL